LFDASTYFMHDEAVRSHGEEAMGITAELVSRVNAVAASAEADAMAMARVCLLDWLGCAIAGAREPVVEVLVADADPGTVGRFAVPGRPELFGLRDAVLVAGAAGHALDYDDGHSQMMGHPAVAVMPAILGAAMAQGVGSDALPRAVIAAYEAAGRIGLMLAPDHYARGFHATGTVGAIAAATGAAAIAGLAPERTVAAIGLAGTRAAGLKASFGTDGKPLHAAWAALVGLTAARWAERGMTAANDIFGHGQGISALSNSFDRHAGLKQSARPQIFGTTFKEHAACGVTHASIRAALKLRADCAGQRIVSIATLISARADDICNIPEPATGLQLKFSLRAVVAMALIGIDTANIATFSDETAQRADLGELIRVSKVELDPELPIGPTQVTVELGDGRKLSASDGSIAALGVEDSLAGVVQKFISLTGDILGPDRAERLRHEVLEEPLQDIVGLLKLTLPACPG
jgi:2-methylcitrate dehydratase PrpD